MDVEVVRGSFEEGFMRFLGEDPGDLDTLRVFSGAAPG